jgi:hypothetical protein
MAWFRTNQGIAAWLAFFALACQLSFSFGHIHINKFAVGPAAQAAIQTADTTADPPPPAPQKDPPGLAGDFCDVCANISLAGALILPILAFLLAPDLFISVARWPLAASEPASFRRRPFYARGPPQA